jgi:hypothetical protein
METPIKAMQTDWSYEKNIYEPSLIYYKDDQIMVYEHQAHLTAQLIKDSNDLVKDTSSDQLAAIWNNDLSVTTTQPESSNRPESQLELLFGITATLLSLYNCINHRTDDTQI